MYGEGHPTDLVLLKMGVLEPLCHSMSTTADCSLHAIWYLLLFLSAVLKICACLSPQTLVRHQNILIFSELDSLNRTNILSGLSSCTPHNRSNFQMVWFIHCFCFSVLSLSYSCIWKSSVLISDYFVSQIQVFLLKGLHFGGFSV